MSERTERLNRLAQSWDDAAEGYEAYFVPRFAPWVDTAVAALADGSMPDGPLLVPCCGTLPELDALVTTYPDREITGIDLSAEMVRLARARAHGHHGVEVIQGDATTIDPQWAGPFAGVVSVFGLQQLPEPDQVMASWARALRTGGRLSVVYWPSITETDGPFALLNDVVGGVPATEPAWWEQALPAALVARGMVVERDEHVGYAMSHESAGDFFDAFTRSGPMRSLANAKGEQYIAKLREAFVSRAPTGALHHRPSARHVVARNS